MFYAVCSDGRQYWMFLRGTNIAEVTIHWIKSLHEALLKYGCDYRQTHVLIVLMADNAPTHTAKKFEAIKGLLKF